MKTDAETRIVIKAIRLARIALETYIVASELGEGGPIDAMYRPEVVRVKAELAVLTAMVDEALARPLEKVHES